FYFSLQRSAPPRDLHSFPTRRSSDLVFTLTPEMLTFFRAAAWRAADELRLLSRTDLSRRERILIAALKQDGGARTDAPVPDEGRSEEHTSELSHVAISYAVFCLKKKT